MNRLDFAGRNAIVTGGAQGIGLAIVERLAASGARVRIWDRDDKLLAKTVAQLGSPVSGERVDVTDAEAIARATKSALDALGKIDVLVNNAGIVHHGSILDASTKDWDQAFAVNVKSMFLVSKAFIPGMLRKGRGSIINMASVASSIRGLPNRFVYGASKAAVIGLTKAIAADFVAKGIRCNAICPGTVDTPSLQGRINAFADPVQARKDFIARQPMGRLGTVEDITGILVFLASDESLFATGNAYSIDGGMTI
jgi:2-keto-3-deoxy-L-fuconate dehydrogenase